MSGISDTSDPLRADLSVATVTVTDRQGVHTFTIMSHNTDNPLAQCQSQSFTDQSDFQACVATATATDSSSSTSVDSQTTPTSGSIILTSSGFSTVPTPAATSSVTSTAGAAGGSLGSSSPDQQKQPSKSGVAPDVIAGAVGVPIVILVLSGFALFWWLKKRRQQFRSGRPTAAAAAEMKMRRSDSVALRQASQPQEPAPVVTASGAGPVMVSSLAPTETRAYYTGIDTSDEVSMHSHAAPSHNFSLDGEQDPPPPYRPRSVAGPPPISRDASVRTNVRNSGVPATAETSLMGRTQEPQNPFADPADDDAVSIISEPEPERGQAAHNHDRLSEVSDMSYQDEPTTVRHNV